MKVAVRFHQRIRQDVADVRRLWIGPRHEQHQWLKTILEIVRSELLKTGGSPVSSRRVGDSMHCWECVPRQLWVVFHRTQRRRWWVWRQVDITVLRIVRFDPFNP